MNSRGTGPVGPGWITSLSAALICACIIITGVALARSLEPAPGEERIQVKFTTQGGDQTWLEKMADGTFRYTMVGPDRELSLSAEEFSDLIYRERTQREWWKRLLNITTPFGVAWVALGFLGQLLFTGRMLVQWLETEKRRESTIPVSFWWMSLGGATMLLIYFVWRKDIVGVIGQGTGWIIYLRNLYFIYANRKRAQGIPD